MECYEKGPITAGDLDGVAMRWGSVGAVSAAALILLLKENWINRIVPHLISYAIGTLLSASLLRMIPRALADLPGHTVMGTLLAGLMGLFLMESLLVYLHCH